MLRALKLRYRILAHRARKAIMLPSSKRRPSDGPLIFILGCPRSGTTLMRKILNSHSRIACPGETWFLGPLIRHLTQPLIVAGFEGLGVGRQEVVANIRETALHYYETYLHRAGKARFADKTPGYSEHIEEIYEIFGPDVRFVYMLRNGLDVCNSLQHEPHFKEVVREFNAMGRLIAAGFLWKIVNRTVRDFREVHPEICHTVRYEELTDKPEEVVRGVLDFLGEKWEPEILDYNAFVHDGTGDFKSEPEQREIRPNRGMYRWWKEEQRRAMAAFLNDDLRAAGYDVDDLLAEPDSVGE